MPPHYDLDPNRKYNIAVVGGGIGGLCTAIGLLHHGIDCEIYEGTTTTTHTILHPHALQLKITQPRAPSQKSAQASP